MTNGNVIKSGEVDAGIKADSIPLNDQEQNNKNNININTNSAIRYPQSLVNKEVCAKVSSLSHSALNATLLVCILCIFNTLKMKYNIHKY